MFFGIVSFLVERRRVVLSAALAILIAAGIVYSLSLGNQIRYMDEYDNVAIATNIAAKGMYSLDGIQPCAFIPPAFAALLAPFIALGAEVVHLRIMNFLLVAGCVVVFYFLLRLQFDERASVIGTLLVILYPLFFYTGGTLFPQTLSGFLFLAFLYFLFLRPFSNKHALLAGITMGVLVLTVQTFLFVLAFSALFLIFFRRSYRQTGVMVAAAMLVIGFWGARNYVVFHRVVPLAVNLDFHLLVGNSENATPTAGVNADISQDTVGAHAMSEIDRHEYYRSRAIDWVVNNPSRAIVLYFGKVLNHFHYTNRLKSEAASIARDMLMLVSYGPMLLLFIVRIVLSKKYPMGEMEKYFASLYVMNAFFQAIFFTRIRFRVPFDYLLIAVAAMTIVLLLDFYFRRAPTSVSNTARS